MTSIIIDPLTNTVPRMEVALPPKISNTNYGINTQCEELHLDIYSNPNQKYANSYCQIVSSAGKSTIL